MSRIRTPRSLLVVVGCIVAVAACSSKSSSSGSSSTTGGSTTAGGGKPVIGAGSQADCGAACGKATKCNLPATDADGNPLSEADCTSSCDGDQSFWGLATCVKDALDCAGVQACKDAASGGGSSGGGSTTCAGEGQGCDPAQPNCCVGAPVCCQSTGTCTYVGGCAGGS